MAEPAIEELREAARNRGLKLLRSRKRKVGVGDYGKLGLTDVAGQPVFGIEGGELTASPEDVWDYLRRGLAATWRESAETAGPASRARALAPVRAKQSKGGSASPPRSKPIGPPELRLVAPPPPAELVVRAATAKDAAGLSDLLVPLGPAGASKKELANSIKRGGWIVADRAGIVGCVAWVTVAEPFGGAIGRIGLLYVAEKARKTGIGRRLIAEAEVAMAQADCRRVEVMSDIDTRNSHEFFRRLDFAQASYRFVREIKS